jgi:hypothetical protein
MTAWNKSQSSLQRALPSVTAILNTAVAAELVQRFGRMPLPKPFARRSRKPGKR